MTWLPDSFQQPPEPDPSARDYARATQNRYFNSAFGIMFLAIWIAVGVGLNLSFWPSLIVTVVVLVLGAFSMVLLIPLLILPPILAWLVGLCLRVEDRRRLIAEHQASDARKCQAMRDNPPPPRKTCSDSWLAGLLIGALLGFWWGDDE